MREIKFRIYEKCKNGGKWSRLSDGVGTHCFNQVMIEASSGQVYDAACSHDDSVDEGVGAIKKRYNCVVQQYTGLKDSLGNEIYEGDVLIWRFPENKNNQCVVRWISELDEYDYSGWETAKTFMEGGANVVVGNIFENPELLEDGFWWCNMHKAEVKNMHENGVRYCDGHGLMVPCHIEYKRLYEK